MTACSVSIGCSPSRSLRRPLRRQARGAPCASRRPVTPRPHAPASDALGERGASTSRPPSARSMPARRQAGQYGGIGTISRPGAPDFRCSAFMARSAVRPAVDGYVRHDLVDLQDLWPAGSHLHHDAAYVLEAAAEHGKSVWCSTGPNPAGTGRVEGLTLRPGWESFVGRRAAANAPRF